MLKIKVNAKINFSLDITGKNFNGYHLLDMVSTSINLGDVLSFNKREDKKVTVQYSDGISFSNDIAIKAANLIIKKYDLLGADIFIEKHIPQKSGLGGSSADASGVIFGLCKLNDFDFSDIEIEDILSIGSDVYYMLYGGTRRIQGTGEIISSLINCPKLDMVLLTDDIGVDTSLSYKTYNYGYNRFNNDELIKLLQKGDYNKASFYFNNALYDSSHLLNDEIDKKMDLLTKTGAIKVFMTGSGSGVIGLYNTSVNVQKIQEFINGKSDKKYGLFYVNNCDKGIEFLR